MIHELSHLIGGSWEAGGETAERHNPADTRDLVARYPQGGKAEAERAVGAARAALPGWIDATPESRADLLERIGLGLAAEAESLGDLIAREEGKTLAEGVGEVRRAARIFRYFAGEAVRAHGRTLRSVRPGVEVATFREPVGAFALITPWNFPIAIPAWKAAPALAFGNTVVLKPAAETSAVAAALARVVCDAGAPPGVFNLLLGGAEAGSALVEHPDVQGVSFTGSQAVGGVVAVRAASRQARVQLEMGGKNPLIVMDDADLDRAVAIALDGAFYSTGQRCTASSRLIVHDGIYARFIARLGDSIAALRVGDPRAPDTQIGPAVSPQQLEKLFRYVDVAKAEGGVIRVGGGRLTRPSPGWWAPPTLVTDTDPQMTVNTEEVFGPLASTIRVKSFDEALEVANAGAYGLSAGIVTNSLKYAREFQRRVRAGMTMVNLPTAGVDYHVPFGGVGSSSYGAREQGFAAVEFYTQTKTAYASA